MHIGRHGNGNPMDMEQLERVKEGAANQKVDSTFAVGKNIQMGSAKRRAELSKPREFNYSTFNREKVLGKKCI